MPKAVWDLPRGTIDDFDRSKQFKPYTGQLPPIMVVYQWRVAKLTYAAGAGGKLPQLRIGLQLVARSEAERQYEGYYITVFRSIGDTNAFTWVPFLDVLGVSESEFRERTMVDNEGKITRIGKWKNDGGQELLAQLTEREDLQGNMRRDVGYIGPVDAESVDDDEDIDDEDDDDDFEEEPPARKHRAAPSAREARSGRPARGKPGTRRVRASEVDDDELGF